MSSSVTTTPRRGKTAKSPRDLTVRNWLFIPFLASSDTTCPTERRSALRARYDALRASLGDLAEIEAAETRARDRVATARADETAAPATAS